MDDSRAPDVPTPEPPQPRTIFDGFRRPASPPSPSAKSEQREAPLPSAASVVDLPSRTVEMPMTGAVRAMVMRTRPSRATKQGTSTLLVFLAILPIVSFLAITVLERLGLKLGMAAGFYITMGIALYVPVLIILVAAHLALSARSGARTARTEKELVKGIYLRTIDRAVLVRKPVEDGNVYKARLLDNDLSFDLDGPWGLASAWLEAVDKTRGGFLGMGTAECELEPTPVTLDYTDTSHILLEMRDAEGKLIYRHPKYHPD